MAPDRRKRLGVAAAIATVIAIPAEGLRQYAYYDPPGILTVCYGSTSGVEKGRFYPMSECRTRLRTEMVEAVEAVERCAPGLPDQVLAAFGDAVFNLGPRIVCDRENSTAARLLAQGRIAEACKQLPRWNKSRIAGRAVELPGLTKRRAAEERLCLTGSV